MTAAAKAFWVMLAAQGFGAILVLSDGGDHPFVGLLFFAFAASAAVQWFVTDLWNFLDGLAVLETVFRKVAAKGKP